MLRLPRPKGRDLVCSVLALGQSGTEEELKNYAWTGPRV